MKRHDYKASNARIVKARAFGALCFQRSNALNDALWPSPTKALADRLVAEETSAADHRSASVVVQDEEEVRS